MLVYAIPESKSPEPFAKNEICWPGLVGMLNLNGCLRKAGIPLSTLRSKDFDIPVFKDGLRQWVKNKIVVHVTSHELVSANGGLSEQPVGDAGIASNRRWCCDRGLLAALCLILAFVLANTRAWADSVTSAQAQRIVSQYSASFTSPASCCSSYAPSGPLMGNGNLGVVVVNPINTMTFLLGKNEFWSLNGGQVEPMASMALSIPGMSGASFAMQENIYTGTVTGQFSLSGNEIQTTSWVSSNDTTNNYLFTQFTYSGSGTQAVTVSLAAGNGNTYPASSGSSGGVLYYNVAADSTSTVGGYNTHQVRIAAGVVGATGTISGSNLSFTLSPGTTVTLVSSIMSNYDSSSYTTQSISNVSGSTASSVSSELSSSEAWWVSFWDASYVEFANNPVLQAQYYGSLYLLACASEPNTAPPGLWGPWVEANPAWAGDYTLDYNYEVPFLASFPTNHVALAGSYDAPVENWLPNAESFAASNGFTGALYPVHIGPLPNGSGETSAGDENLKSNGAYAATVMLEHYYVTQSPTYAASIWPTISELATFWQNYLTWNGTSYDDLNDAQQENDAYPQTNGTMSLGLLRNVLQGAINLSTVLGESSSQRADWQNILDNLTTFNGLPFPNFTEGGLQVFDLTQVGEGDQGLTTGDVRPMAIYPGNQVGLGSSPALLTVAQNTFAVMCCSPYGNGWGGGNYTNTFYPGAARVGYNPNTILSQLTSWVNGHGGPSFWIGSNGGGVEGFNTVPSTISEMMMQSFQGNIIVFPDWPSGTNAHFGDNLAYGNFLVSSAIYNNAVLYVRIISQAGQTASITNPWPGQSVQFYRNGANEGTLSGTTLSITTSTNDVLLLAPSGTSDATITSEMEDSLSGLNSLGGNGGPGSVLPYNVNAIYTNGSTFLTGGADNDGNALSATLLGASQVFNGTTFTYGPSNALDAFTNATVTLKPGLFSTLNILAFAVNGSQASQTFQVNYTNGTYSTATQSISDWANSQGYSGETKVVTMAYANTSTGGENSGTHYIYGYTIPVTSSLTVESITLPANGSVIVLGIQDEATTVGSEGPYGGTPAGIPGTLLAENYDTGGQGTGYNVTSTNGTDNGYRSDGVDLETTSAPGGGNDIGWTTGGQWFNYTVNVATAGTYNVTFEVAAPSAVTDGFHVSNSTGSNLSGSVNVPATGGWQTWTTVTATVTLPAGQQILTVYQDNGGWNIDSAAFALAGLATGTPYNIVNENSGSCIMANGSGTGSGTAVVQYACANGTYSTEPSQQWEFTNGTAPGYYEVTNVNAPSESWNASGNGSTNGTPIILWPYTGTSNAEWEAVSLGNGYFEFVGQGSGLCLDTPGGATTNGLQYQIYACNSTSGQAFKLVSPTGVTLPYNVNAIYTNGTTFGGGADGNGNALSATLLGSSTTWNGTTFTYGPANAVDAFSNVSIPLSSGSFSSLNVLAFAVNGSQASQTFTVHYTNGTTSTATQGISDWCNSQGYSGETQVLSMAYRNTSTGGEWGQTCYVYGYTIPVTSGLTVSSLSIPANGSVIVLGVQDQQ